MNVRRRESQGNYLHMIEQDLKLRYFAENYIKALQCNRFVPDESGKCYCGRPKGEHTNLGSDNSKPWNKKTDLIQIPTNAYGEIKLSGFRVLAGVHLKFIRACQTETLSSDLYHVMTKIWEFQKPELIISINGGAKKMVPLSYEQKSAFKRGLINVSKAASTWIITGGFNFGVSKLVGEAARDHNIGSQDKAFTVLGIGAWGSVYNRKDLILKEGNRRVTYNNADGQFTLKGQAPLDPNHDAFILFDGGIDGVFGMEIRFRTEFEMFISRKAKCSVVQVIVEGGKKCIETADEALMQGIPVVVMKGSKRAADLICDVIEADKDSKMEVIENGLKSYEKEWAIKNIDEMNNLKNNLISLYEFRQKKLIHIFSMSDFTKNLDRAILEAAFSGKIDGNELTSDEKLRLAMTFNRPDVAEECILETSLSKNQLTNYGEYMKSALKKNHWQFVNLFLSRGTQVESFLTKHLLEELYFGAEVSKYINHNISNILQYLKVRVRPTNPDRLSTIGLIVKMLTANVVKNLYHRPERITDKCCGNTDEKDDDHFNADEIVDFETCHDTIIVTKRRKQAGGACPPYIYGNEKYENHYIYTSHPPKNHKGQILYTEQDLFIWSLLTQRWEMAKIFWETGKDHIGSALIACVICKSMSEIAMKEGEIEMMVTLENNHREYEVMAISILSEVYWRDKVRTHLLLMRALPYWGRLTCMEIASKCNLINFLSHSACQTRLNSIWLGGMSQYTTTPLFLINLPFAFLTSKWLISPSRIIENYDAEPKVLPQENAFDSDFEDDDVCERIPGIHEKESPMAMSDSNVPIIFKEEEYLTKFRQKQQSKWKNLSFGQAVSFYYNAPITKFYMFIISYFVFLTIYTYMCLVELSPLASVTLVSQRQTEYIVYTYVLSFVLDGIRGLVENSQYGSLKSKFWDWLSYLWNIFDLLLYIVFLIAVILRHISTIDFVYARVFFSIALSMYYVRFLEFFYGHRTIGPAVISIGRMILDIIFIFALLVVAIFAYGTLVQALLYSNSNLEGFLLKNIVFIPFWQFFGELNVDYVQGQVQLNNVSATPNAIVVVAFAIYILFAKALLMHVLAAMFTITFQNVEDNSNKIWAFNRYKLIEEFYFKPILPAPINVFEIIYRSFRGIGGQIKKKTTLKKNDFVVNLCHWEDLRSSGFEQQCMEACLIDQPHFRPHGDRDRDQSTSQVCEGKDVSGAEVLDCEEEAANEKWIYSVVETMNEMKLEMKAILAEFHKVRNHQKKVMDSSRSNARITEPTTTRDTSRDPLLPIDGTF